TLEQHQRLSGVLSFVFLLFALPVPASVFYKDKENRLIRVNKTLADALGFPKEEIEGKLASEISPHEDEKYWEDDKEVMSSGKAKMNIIEPLVTPKGIRWLRTDKIPYKDDQGNIIGVIGFAIDITERKQAQQEILQAKEDWERTFNSLPDLIAIIDDNHQIIRVNKAMAATLGVAPDDAIGLKCYEHFHGTEEPPPYCPHDKLLTNHREHAVEVYEEKLDGDFLITVSPLHGPDGCLIGCIHVARDITERRQAEKEKAKLQDRLQQAQKMESIGMLAGGIAHDFNNILFPIIGFAEMALEDTSEGSSLRHSINEILHGAKRAGDLVKQILTFSRQADQELKPLQVHFVIKEVLKLMRSSLPSTIKIKQYLKKDCGFVIADPTQIHQIAMNLMTNAYQAMEDEGGKLEVTLKEVELGLDDLTDPSMTPGAYVCLIVSDTGPGMDQSVISRIFEPYFTTKENGKGTGLGLAVVHGIVKSYKGDIRVYSEPGKGTAFHVYLPAIKSQVETEEADAAATVLKGTERILLVDDEETIVRMETQMLERLGYDVTERTSSIEALEAFRAAPDKFDLVITDMTMPNMTGVQLSQKLLEIRPDIPIIICTGFSTKIDDEKAKVAGIRGYVMKPVVMRELAKKIREVLDQG
ncbi:MAG: PAS domain-containing protein, partial [Candidatus Desulfatibia sp.]|uniref:hybrid sensor histidine kinase/response regulator n=1 Tax=Candidatus Desulfatibia sp. TaxID=3101189 RepID=UPI002F2EB478